MIFKNVGGGGVSSEPPESPLDLPLSCPPVRGDNLRTLASGLSYVQVDKHGITIS